MVFPDSYFSLTEGKALVSGAKHSVILDFHSGKIHRINASARSILELGGKKFNVNEVLEKLGTRLEASDTTSFMEELADQGLIKFSSSPEPEHPKERPLPKLDFLWVELTSHCNLRCIHCYAEAETCTEKRHFPTLSTEDIKRVIDDAVLLGCREVQFTGGEPTLRSDLKELIEHARTKGLEVEVFTNGNLLDESMIKFLSEKKVNVAMSIYSHKAETHNAITRVPGSFEKTLESLKLLLAYEVPTRCAIVAMKQNEDELEETSYFLSRLGVLNRPPDPIRPTGRGKGMEFWPEKYGLRTVQTKPEFFVSRENYDRNRWWNSCWYGKAAVTASGEVIPCVFARKQVVGDIRRQSLSEIVKGERMLSLWSLTKDHVEVCKDCEFRYVCEDCRPWAVGFTDSLCAKSPRCTYDPYAGEWAGTGAALSQAGECVGKSD